MSDVKLFFDNCIGSPISDAIGNMLRFHNVKPVVRHIKEYFDQSTPDDIWIPQIAKEGWIVITADKAKRYGGPKLPTICKNEKLTHILISGKLHNAPQFEKARAIISLFPKIVTAAKEPSGTRYSMHYTGERSLMLERKETS